MQALWSWCLIIGTLLGYWIVLGSVVYVAKKALGGPRNGFLHGGGTQAHVMESPSKEGARRLAMASMNA